jgi:sporadic carbohydrate cluster protein (TIGR04323 family)
MSNEQAGSSPVRNVLQGYVVNVEFGGFRIPAPLQNLQLRDYAARNNLQFKLSVGEYSFPGCCLQLEGLYPQLHSFEGIGMCSLFMLPKSEERRQRLYSACLNAGAALHLVLEGIVLRKSADIQRVEEILAFHRSFAFCPTTIPRELLPELSVNDSFT